MRFKRLKLSGFKSFVDPTELRIEPGLTGVVGPNGCGKSNLLEALRWVMGEGSAKSLRGGGMEDVIFAGTAQRPARDFAEVQLLAETADNDDGEIEVVRRIERGAGSAYRLNGRDVRAKDVALLFADAATGAHSPALVSQGRISAVIAAKPTERRAMLEEAAGIAGLHVRRKDAEQKLRATEANLTRLGELIGDMETRSGQLKRQARAAERYRAISADIKIAEARLIFARWREAAQAAEAAKKEAAAAEDRVHQLAEAQRAAAAWNAEATRKLGDARAAAQAARDRANEIGHKLATARAELAGAERRLAELTQARERLAADREREGALANDAAEAIARLTAEAKALETRVAAAEAGRPGLVAELASAESTARDAEVALAQALSAQAREQAEAQIARSAAGAAQARLARAQRELARVDAEIAQLGVGDDLATARDEAAARRAAAEQASAAAAEEIERAEAERAQAAADRERAEAELASARAALAALESEAVALDKALQRASGDRLIDHVRAAPGYERALAAAFGDELETALAGWSELAPDPAIADSLAAHVTAPVVLARRVAQIAVCETDDGRALAPGQQLVTLAGAMRRWDGFAATDAGAAAAERLIRANRLDALRAALPGARAAVEIAQAAMETASGHLAAGRAAADEARRALSQAESDARNARREEDAAEAAIERFAARQSELANRRERSVGERDEAAREAEEANVRLAALPDGGATAQFVASLSAQSEAARAAVSEKRALAATLERSIAGDRERQAAAQAEVKGWRARAGEAAKRIEEMARRERAAEAELAALTDTPAALREEIAALESQQAEARTEAESLAAGERAAEAQVREGEATLAQAGEALAQARETRAGAVARAEAADSRRIEMGRVSGERFECPPPVLPERIGFSSSDVRDPAEESARHDKLNLDRERLGPVNLVAEQELREVETELERSISERDELTQAVNRLRGSIGSLNREGRARLLAAFEEVDRHFRRLFARLFNGGEAYLQLVDSDDPLEAGLEIMAQPPGKKLGSLTLLSGGEQALTAVALIFGLFLTNPAPICVLDEVDAPLDDANIERFCDLLDTMVTETDTRYLIVTHNAVTMSRMHRLFGVTMVERGVSRLVSVDLGGAEELLAAE
ncbi:chromosome partition protein Smc [Sphingomonas changbaiensis NBRC 104936]|uniref:Chromosome partition protein Smc n=1 Tax=Sphingomonas changbaiensis NBRC 104936 TaxID=1219043 RepID=A0A0E9MQY5_9SPHN|nr:AAA family ATPase [Sphingomonas changbaiensis]GAO39878.1 chromosome partition protein Smc [Sphingomonas changbaiensis NBRC 104936]